LISTGLSPDSYRDWEKVIIFKLAAMALSKQYCLKRTKDDELYCVSKFKNNNPNPDKSGLQPCPDSYRDFFGYFFGFAELDPLNRVSVVSSHKSDMILDGQRKNKKNHKKKPFCNLFGWYK
jgi:hypothetical protein